LENSYENLPNIELKANKIVTISIEFHEFDEGIVTMKGFQGFSRSFFFAVAAAVATQTNEYLKNQHFGNSISLVISAIAGVILARGVEWLTLELPMNVRILRRIIDPKAQFEGNWLIHVEDDPEKPLCVATIEYNTNTSNYDYHGVAFDKQGNTKATWHSEELYINLDKSQVIHIGEGKLFGNVTEIVKNFGMLDFEKNVKGSFTRGYAFFVDFGTVPVKRYYFLDRIDSLSFSSSIRKSKFATHEDMRVLVNEYNKLISGNNNNKT
jgi:hypothetical protein